MVGEGFEDYNLMFGPWLRASSPVRSSEGETRWSSESQNGAGSSRDRDRVLAIVMATSQVSQPTRLLRDPSEVETIIMMGSGYTKLDKVAGVDVIMGLDEGLTEGISKVRVVTGAFVFGSPFSGPQNLTNKQSQKGGKKTGPVCVGVEKTLRLSHVDNMVCEKSDDIPHVDVVVSEQYDIISAGHLSLTRQLP
ncbi:hypothetical protein LWI28_024484 [Acer negundo]|uniref:Uncharacterized protein n=1 Tax=Acer negundo TaxID=4023 RepID=A0AAD5IG92_ACENE|nr:hypothetical protein LWI28_024484 [Acer negundo]